MTIAFDMASEPEPGSYGGGMLGFTLYYGSKNYKYFRNVRSFGIYDLWSQIGGFIGMLLGYSLIQTPSIMREVIAKTKSKTSKIYNNVLGERVTSIPSQEESEFDKDFNATNRQTGDNSTLRCTNCNSIKQITNASVSFKAKNPKRTDGPNEVIVKSLLSLVDI